MGVARVNANHVYNFEIPAVCGLHGRAGPGDRRVRS